MFSYSRFRAESGSGSDACLYAGDDPLFEVPPKVRSPQIREVARPVQGRRELVEVAEGMKPSGHTHEAIAFIKALFRIDLHVWLLEDAMRRAERQWGLVPLQTTFRPGSTSRLPNTQWRLEFPTRSGTSTFGLRHRLSILLGLGAIALTGCSTLESSPSLAAATTLGKLVADSNAERPLHVIFVHGMAAEGAGNSGDLQSALRRFMNVTQTAPAQKTMLDIGPPPGPGEFGFDVWDGDTRKWKRSRPFVLRSVYRSGGKVVVFDEVNWWPLLFPIKCRRLLIPEAQLTGPDKDRLRLCAKGSKEDESSHYFPWIEESDLSRVLDTRPRMEPAPMNAAVKSGVITWGLSDATLALGPLRMRIRTAMDAAFQQAMEVSELDRSARDATRDQQFVVISESLGSFAVLDTFQNPTGSESGGVREVLNRTGFLYFFANQFALLELGRSDAGAQIDALSTTSAASLLEAWSQVKATVLDKDAKPAARQIVAYSDPSDLLTFDVPDLLGVDVYNVSVRNATRWLGLFAWPAKAHTGHASNPAVLKSMFGSVPGPGSVAATQTGDARR